MNESGSDGNRANKQIFAKWSKRLIWAASGLLVVMCVWIVCGLFGVFRPLRRSFEDLLWPAMVAVGLIGTILSSVLIVKATRK